MSALLAVGVGAAGATGAVTRVLLERAVSRRTGGRWGIVVVNVTGSLLLGLVVEALLARHVGADTATVLGTGVCGAFTTFSTYAVDVVETARVGNRAHAGAYAVVPLVGGLLAAALGLGVGSALWA